MAYAKTTAEADINSARSVAHTDASGIHINLQVYHDALPVTVPTKSG